MNTTNKIKVLNLLSFIKTKLYFLRPIIRPIYVKFFAKKQKYLRNKIFLDNAIDVLERFNMAMKEGGIQYTLAFGTLLGAIREKGFIKHDFDIDVAVWSADYSPLLQRVLFKYGFKMSRRYTVENGNLAREETYSLNGVSIDIFFFYPAIDQYPYCCDFLNHYGAESFIDSTRQYSKHMVARRIQLPLSHDITYVHFDRLVLPIPTNSAEILSFRYGPDYMTPNPNWSMTQSYNKYITLWEGMKVDVE